MTMWKKALSMNGDQSTSENSAPSSPAQSTSTAAAKSDSVPQLQVEPVVLTQEPEEEEDEPTHPAPKIIPTPRPPRDGSSGSSSGSKLSALLPQLQQLEVSAPPSTTLIPPTPIDSPSHPLIASPPLPTSTSCLAPTPAPASVDRRSTSQHRRNSSSGSGTSRDGSRTYRETLNAYAVDSGDGTRSVNQYRLDGVSHLGKGSYATVEKATDRETGIEYAIKEFSKRRLRQIAAAEAARRSRAASRGRGRGRGGPRGGGSTGRAPAVDPDQGKDGQDNLDLIRTEVAIMKKVKHDNIASVHEVIDVTSDDALLIVLELCAGGPIIRIHQNETIPEDDPRRLSEQKCRDVFQQLVLGVAYLHHNHIVHRDIKPDNCLFLEDMKTVKLIDFGISKFTVAEKGLGEVMEKSAGGGSPAYMAPELLGGDLQGTQHRQDLHGYACDVWSLGVTLYALVCGRLPFDDPDPSVMFKQIRETNPTIPATLDPALQHLLLRLLDKESHTRITIRELWDDPWITDSGRQPLVPYEENCVAFAEPTAAELDKALNTLRASTFLAMSVVAKLKGMRRSGSADRERGRGSTGGSITPPRNGSEGGTGHSSPMISSPLSSPMLSPTAFTAEPGETSRSSSHFQDGRPTPERKPTECLEGLDEPTSEEVEAEGERTPTPTPASKLTSEPEEM